MMPKLSFPVTDTSNYTAADLDALAQILEDAEDIDNENDDRESSKTTSDASASTLQNES
jgi:hypothetical protein